MMSSRYRDAFAEVYVILGQLRPEDAAKIPPAVMAAIDESRNIAHRYELEPAAELRNQPMLRETRAILFNLFRDYLAAEPQREKIVQMQQEERHKKERAKQEKYGTSVFTSQPAAAPPVSETAETAETAEMVAYQESWLRKVISRIKALLGK